MRKSLIILILFVSLLLTGAALKDQELFMQARYKILDKNWNEGLKLINQLQSSFPKSKYIVSSLFYEAKCLEKLNRNRSSVRTYEEFISKTDNKELKEQAKIAVIDISNKEYSRGKKAAADKIVAFLENDNNRVVRYYAALKLSDYKDKNIALKAAPELLDIISEQGDEELLSRAKLALVKIDPKLIDKIEDYAQYKNKIIVIEFTHKTKIKSKALVKLPLALADIALQSVSEKDISDLRKRGIDLKEMMLTLSKNSKEIISIETEEAHIKMWVE